MEQKIGSLDDVFKGIDVNTMDLEELCAKFTEESKGLKCSFYEDYCDYILSFGIQSRLISNIEKIKDINPEYIVAILDYFWVKEIVDILGEEKLYWLSNIYDDVKGSMAFKGRLVDDMQLMAESDVNDYRSYLYYLADTYYSFLEPYIISYEVLLSKLDEFFDFITDNQVSDSSFINDILFDFKENAGNVLWNKLLSEDLNKLERLFYSFKERRINEDLLTI